MIVNNTDNNYYFCRRDDKGEFVKNDKINLNEMIINNFLNDTPFKLINDNKEYYLINEKYELCYYDVKEQKIKKQEDTVKEHNKTFWHLNNQSYFNEENREVKININDRRADILINNYQLEFQHSNLEEIELKQRTEDYLKNINCKNLFWILNYTDNNDFKIINNDSIEININKLKNYICLKDYKNVYLLIEHNDTFYYINKEILNNINEYLNKNQFTIIINNILGFNKIDFFNKIKNNININDLFINIDIINNRILIINDFKTNMSIYFY